MSLRGKVVLFMILAMVALTLVTGGNFYFQGKVDRAGALSVGVMEALANLQQARVAERTFLQEGNPDLAKQAETLLLAAQEGLRKQKDAAHTEQVSQELEAAANEVAAYREILGRVRDNVIQIFKNREAMLQAGINLAENSRKKLVEPLTQMEGELFLESGSGLDEFLANLRTGAKELVALGNRLVLNVQTLYVSNDEKRFTAERKQIKDERELLEYNISAMLPNVKKKEFVQVWNDFKPENQTMVEMEGKLLDGWRQNRDLMATLDKAAKALASRGQRLQEESRGEMQDTARLSNILGLSISAGAVGILLVWGLYLIRSTFGPLRRSVSALHQVVDEVSSSSLGRPSDIPAALRRRLPAGRQPGGDQRLPGGDVLHDPPERRQRRERPPAHGPAQGLMEQANLHGAAEHQPWARSPRPASRPARSSRPSTRSPSRPTSWPSTPPWRPPGRARPAPALPWWPRRCATWPCAPPRRPRTPRISSRAPWQGQDRRRAGGADQERLRGGGQRLPEDRQAGGRDRRGLHRAGPGHGADQPRPSTRWTR